MSHEVHEYHDAMHSCPKCGKRSLARVGEGHFHCLWCGFRRNITEGEYSYNGGPLGALLVVSLLAVMVMSLVRPGPANYDAPSGTIPQAAMFDERS
jgi:predicted nucleic-acid-binding Zn-ribbon protein